MSRVRAAPVKSIKSVMEQGSRNMNKFYITGISGVGKSSLVKELRKSGIQAYDLDDTELCHWKHKVNGTKAEYYTGIGRDWLEAHDYVCDSGGLKKLIDVESDTVVVIAGLASNQNEYIALFDKIFLLHCSEKTFLHRLNTRDEGNKFAKDTSEQEHILNWYKDFEKEVREKGAISINTDSPLQSVTKQVVSHMSPK